LDILNSGVVSGLITVDPDGTLIVSGGTALSTTINGDDGGVQVAVGGHDFNLKFDVGLYHSRSMAGASNSFVPTNTK
jgi:hypothetical protein